MKDATEYMENLMLKYPTYYAVLKKYDDLLKDYGLEITICDGKRWEDYSWSIAGNIDYGRIGLKDLIKRLNRDFDLCCARCGKTIEKEVRIYDNKHHEWNPDVVWDYPDWVPTGGFISENATHNFSCLCNKCKYKAHIGWGQGIYSYLSSYYHYVEHGQPELAEYLGNRKIKFINKENHTSYCRCKSIKRNDNNEYFLGSDKIIPIGYDMGLRDIYGERIYSSQSGVFMKDGKIFGFDASSLPTWTEADLRDIEELKCCPIIVTKDRFYPGEPIFNDPYHVSVDEFLQKMKEAKG